MRDAAPRRLATATGSRPASTASTAVPTSRSPTRTRAACRPASMRGAVAADAELPNPASPATALRFDLAGDRDVELSTLVHGPPRPTLLAGARQPPARTRSPGARGRPRRRRWKRVSTSPGSARAPAGQMSKILLGGRRPASSCCRSLTEIPVRESRWTGCPRLQCPRGAPWLTEGRGCAPPARLVASTGCRRPVLPRHGGSPG